VKNLHKPLLPSPPSHGRGFLDEFANNWFLALFGRGPLTVFIDSRIGNWSPAAGTSEPRPADLELELQDLELELQDLELELQDLASSRKSRIWSKKLRSHAH